MLALLAGATSFTTHGSHSMQHEQAGATPESTCTTQTFAADATPGAVDPASGSPWRPGTWFTADDNYFHCAWIDRVSGHCGTRESMDLTTCTTFDADSGLYTRTYAAGPFTSTGGYSWRSIHFNATLATDDHPAARRVAIRSYSFGTHQDSADGPELGFPPLHNHHTTVTGHEPDASTAGASPGRMWLGQQADGQCSGQLDGFSCLEHDLRPGGYYVPFNSDWELVENSLWNDGRPENSPQLVWFFKWTVVWEPLTDERESALQPVAEWGIVHPFVRDSSDNTLEVPIDRDSFYVMEGVVPQSGAIIRAPPNHTLSHVHTHAIKFQRAFLINATAAELGLDATRFASSNGCDVVNTTHAGFASNEEMIQHLTTAHPRLFSLTDPDSRLICRAIGSTARVGDYNYDRKSQFDCAANSVRVGDPFTAVVFFGSRQGEEAAPSGACSSMGAANAHNNINAYPIHMHWFIYIAPTWDNPTPRFVNQYEPLLGVPANWTAQTWENDNTTRCNMMNET